LKDIRERASDGNSLSRAVAFITGLARDPAMVGTVVPSSRFLEQRLVRQAEIARARTVVELGPGIGGTTRALLRALPADGRLLAIEREAAYAKVVRTLDDPRLIVRHASAEQLAALIADAGLDAPDAVVSGIPFSAIPTDVGREILRAVWDCLAPGGRFVAYQFRDHVARLGRELIGEPLVQVEYVNAPPLRVYRWCKPDANECPQTRYETETRTRT
jgi:phosphatidylethanolamine/phosphatidyl-N-methylethanolamine N-methyltransferase